MGQITIKLLRKFKPEQRLIAAAYLFWLSLVGGTWTTVVFAHNAFEKIVMGISWLAITLTCVDIIETADVRAEQEK